MSVKMKSRSRRFIKDLLRSVPLSFVWLWLWGAILCGAAGAQEAPQLSFKEHYERAVARFKAGQFDEAVAGFQAAYEMKPLPLLLFNLAQAHRKAGHQKQALELYERFLVEEKKPDLRPDAERYIAEIKGQLEAEQREREEAERRERARQEAERLARIPEPPPTGWENGPPKRPPGPYRILKWVAAGAGLLAIGAGAALLAVDGRPYGCALAEGQALCPQQLNTIAGGAVGVGVGAALLGTSAAFFVLDYRRERDGQVAMAAFGGRF